jgi:O-antigen/teichoic acid export membrane protein
MRPRQKTLAIFCMIALCLTATHWTISPPNARHGMTGALVFTVIAWALWFVCLAPVWLPYMVARRAVRVRTVAFLASSLLLLVIAAASVFIYSYGENFVHWGTITVAVVCLVAAAIQFWQGVVGRRAPVTPAA